MLKSKPGFNTVVALVTGPARIRRAAETPYRAERAHYFDRVTSWHGR
jgi:hypothetical protein